MNLGQFDEQDEAGQTFSSDRQRNLLSEIDLKNLPSNLRNSVSLSLMQANLSFHRAVRFHEENMERFPRKKFQRYDQ